MPRYWLTIHWPHPVDEREAFPWYVYLQHEYRPLGEALAVGDGIAFYETKHGRAHRNPAGELVRLHRGRQGVVCVATVSAPLRVRTLAQNVRTYEDGEVLNWAWEVPCDGHQWGNPVPVGQVLDIVGRGNMRVRGGLVEVSAGQFHNLRDRLGL